MAAGADVLESMERLHRARGTAMTLHRAGVSPDVTVYAKAYGADDRELAGTMTDVVRKMRITNAAIAAAAWPGPPRRGDTIGGYIVETCDTRQIGDLVVAHIMDVAKAG